MSQSASTVLQFIAENGVYFGGAAAFLFYLFEIYSNLGRHHRTPFENFSSIVFLLTAAVSSGFAFYTFQQQFTRKVPAVKAADGIHATYAACLSANRVIPESLRIDIEQKVVRPVELQCLAHATKVFRPMAGDLSSLLPRDALANDFLLGHRLLAEEQQRRVPFGLKHEPQGVYDALKKYFGIYQNTFLGTGYSVPQASISGRARYSDARLTEYWVGNFCAEATLAPQLCPERSPRVWAWKLDVGDINSKYLREILERSAPREGADEYERYKLEPENVDEPAFIRFQKFPEQYYKGTVGRPEAMYVFFSSRRETESLTVREAMRRSGQTDKEIDDTKPGQAVFVWLVAPSGSQHSTLATWQNLFDLLGDVVIDSRLKRPIVAGD